MIPLETKRARWLYISRVINSSLTTLRSIGVVMSVIYNITLDDHFHDVLLLLLLLLLYGTGTLHANSLPFRQSSFFRLAPPAPLLSLFATLVQGGRRARLGLPGPRGLFWTSLLEGSGGFLNSSTALYVEMRKGCQDGAVWRRTQAGVRAACLSRAVKSTSSLETLRV